MVGWEPCSIGYHGDDGNIFFGRGRPMEPKTEKPYKSGDVIGVSFDAERHTAPFNLAGVLK